MKKTNLFSVFPIAAVRDYLQPIFFSIIWKENFAACSSIVIGEVSLLFPVTLGTELCRQVKYFSPLVFPAILKLPLLMLLAAP